MDRINCHYLRDCQKRHMQCLHDGGTDAYFSRNRVYGYVTGQPLNEHSNCFIVTWRLLLSVWFNPLDDTVYAEARFSEKYPIYISGIHSMRNMKLGGSLQDYPLLSTFGPHPLTPERFDKWMHYVSRHTDTLLSLAKER